MAILVINITFINYRMEWTSIHFHVYSVLKLSYIYIFLCKQKTGRIIVVNPTNDPEKDKDMVQHLLGMLYMRVHTIIYYLWLIPKRFVKRFFLICQIILRKITIIIYQSVVIIYTPSNPRKCFLNQAQMPANTCQSCF